MRNRKRPAVVALLALLLASAVAAVTLPGCGNGEEPSATPRITSISPAEGPAGTQVAITGTGFGTVQGTSVVHVGDIVAQVVSWADTAITVRVPDGLAAAVQGITVLTPEGESNDLEFTVTSKASAPDRKEGQVENPTPASAMLSWMKKNGVNAVGWTFSVIKLSQVDPNWKIDQASKAGQKNLYFLLKKVNGNWTVVDDGNALTPQELQGDGAPSDLWVQVPAPVPSDQLQVVNDYLKSQGVDMTNVAIGLVKASPSDPSWELFQVVFPPERQMTNYYAVLHLENNAWVVKNYAANIDNTPGMPADLKP